MQMMRTLQWRCLKLLMIKDYSLGLQETRQCIYEIGNILNISEMDLSFLELVVDEAITNALEAELAQNLHLIGIVTDRLRLIDYLDMRHSIPKPTCTLSFWIKEDLLRIEVLDSGPGFVYKNNNDEEPSIWSGRGRGCLIMKSYMDQVNWKKRSSGGTRCVLIKQISNNYR